MLAAVASVSGGSAALLSSLCADSVQGPNQRRLFRDLLHGYNRPDRPVVNNSHTLLVELNLSLMQIIDLVRRQHVATLWAGSTCLTLAQLFSVDLVTICKGFFCSLAGWKEPDFNNQRFRANGENSLHIWWICFIAESWFVWFFLVSTPPPKCI